jgi:hypothetical protein
MGFAIRAKGPAWLKKERFSFVNRNRNGLFTPWAKCRSPRPGYFWVEAFFFHSDGCREN